MTDFQRGTEFGELNDLAIRGRVCAGGLVIEAVVEGTQGLGFRPRMMAEERFGERFVLVSDAQFDLLVELG